MIDKEKDRYGNVKSSYLEELELYLLVVNFVMVVSLNQHGIKTDGRGIRAMKIFTKQTLSALSLDKLLPKQVFEEEAELWDISSIASLTRNIIEGYLSLYYFGLENISEEEAELRFILLQLHKNNEWYAIRKDEMLPIEISEFESVINDQKNKLKNHKFLPFLSASEQARVKQGKEMYVTKEKYESKLSVCKDLRKIYRHLSNLVHPLPLSIERTDNARGRGVGTNADVNYCLICVMLARKYLAATVIGIVDRFKSELGEKFHDEILLVRPLITKGF
jgi:hypothetical protein